MENYFKEVNEKIDNMTDEEFDKTLKDSGLEKCPYENEEKKYLVFKKTMRDGKEIAWVKNEEYIVIFEDEKLYQTDNNYAIDKCYEGKYFKVITK